MTEFRRALADVLDRDGPTALGPEGGAGYPPLRDWLAAYLRQNGLDATPDDILLTSGTQQTISLVAATLLQPGDRVITEVPTWPGALEVFEAAGARVIGIPSTGRHAARPPGRRPGTRAAAPHLHGPTPSRTRPAP